MSKLDFVRKVLTTHGVLVWFDGNTPKKVAGRRPPKETFKQWTLRVLEQKPAGVTALMGGSVRPNTHMSTLASDSMGDVVKKMLNLHAKAECQLALAERDTDELHARRTLERKVAKVQRKLSDADASLGKMHEELLETKAALATEDEDRLGSALSSHLKSYLAAHGGLLDELVVAQVRMHEAGLASGEASVADFLEKLIRYANDCREARKKADEYARGDTQTIKELREELQQR